MGGPLTGLTVIEMEGLGPCPLAGQFLADLGAEVIVIVRKSSEADPTDINNRSKKSVALNLKSPEGVDIAFKLVARSDILIEGFRPGVMERMGLGPEICQERNPGLIYGRITGWGQTGPLADCAGHDINYMAITGFLNAIGKPGEPPLPPLNIAADYAGGTMFLLLGILSALYERHKSGKGQIVDAAMVDGVPALMALIHSWLARGNWEQERGRNLLDGGAPYYRTYETSDGKYISVGPLEPQFFSRLVELAGLPELDDKARKDQNNWPEMHQAYEQIFLAKTRDGWTDILEGTDACFAPVLSWSEAPHHHHLHERGTFVDVDNVMQAAPAPRFSRTPASVPVTPNAPGSDTEQILKEIGYDNSTITNFRENGVLT
ncbi:MAG: CaiB/BaiF CoA transferase family protein [Rhizobiaceae bacterium]